MKKGDIVTLRHNWNTKFYGRYGTVYYVHSTKYYLFHSNFHNNGPISIPPEFQYVAVQYDHRTTIGFPRILLRRVEDGTVQQLLDYALWKMKN